MTRLTQADLDNLVVRLRRLPGMIFTRELKVAWDALHQCVTDKLSGAIDTDDPDAIKMYTKVVQELENIER